MGGVTFNRGVPIPVAGPPHGGAGGRKPPLSPAAVIDVPEWTVLSEVKELAVPPGTWLEVFGQKSDARPVEGYELELGAHRGVWFPLSLGDLLPTEAAKARVRIAPNTTSIPGALRLVAWAPEVAALRRPGSPTVHAGPPVGGRADLYTWPPDIFTTGEGQLKTATFARVGLHAVRELEIGICVTSFSGGTLNTTLQFIGYEGYGAVAAYTVSHGSPVTAANFPRIMQIPGAAGSAVVSSTVVNTFANQVPRFGRIALVHNGTATSIMGWVYMRGR